MEDVRHPVIRHLNASAVYWQDIICCRTGTYTSRAQIHGKSLDDEQRTKREQDIRPQHRGQVQKDELRGGLWLTR